MLISKERKHPKGKKLSEALAEDADRLKAQKGLTDKKATLIKAPGVEKEAEAGEAMRPTDAQLATINEFTRKTVTADEVVTFSTLSCNDIVDRDDDQFSTKCVKTFGELEQPFSPVGKSYMLNHSRDVQDAVGRIYTASTKKVSGSTFLINDVYIPNTEQYAKLIEDINFGVAWAVSVGVVLGKTECTVCGAGFSSWGYWCQEGHDKGLFYDPKSTETDSWGYPVPCDPKTPGAVKCVRQFDDPKDFYELSQVFLGAQYFAALEKQPDFAAVMKSVGESNVPILGLSEEEASKLPLRHEPKKVSDARLTYGVKELDDGSLMWVDENDLRWTYDPENPADGVLSLGKAIKDPEEDQNDGEADDGSEPGEDLAAVDGEHQPVEQLGDAEGDEGKSGDQPEAGGAVEGGESGAEGSVDADADDESDDDEDEDSETDDESDEDADEDEEKSVTTATVVAAARAAKLPIAVIERIESSKKDGVTSLALAVALEIKGLQEKVSEMEPKAALGDEYLKELRSEALHFYTLSRMDPKDPKKGVKVESFQKVLDRVGDDVDLLKEIIAEQKEAAQEKFPKSVRRSSFPEDPNKVPEKPEGASVFTPAPTSDNDKKVSRLHS
jgi:hypothetical protein